MCSSDLPVHRLLGWISKPSAFGDRRQAWRLDQLRGLAELEAMVQGDGADTDLPTCERLPTLIEAALLDRHGDPIGTLADAAVDLSSGRILHYLVSRSDPRLPGSSRWRLSPDRIVDQQPGQVSTGLSGLDDLPLARASVRQELLRRSRRWRDQVKEAGDRFEERFSERLEGWLEEPADEPPPDRYRDSERRRPEAWDDWDGWEQDPIEPPPPPSPQSQSRRRRPPEEEDDPWV